MLPHHGGCAVVPGRMGYERQEFTTIQYSYVIWDVKVILGALLRLTDLYTEAVT